MFYRLLIVFISGMSGWISALNSSSLVALDPESSTISIDKLTQVWAQRRLPLASKSAALDRAIRTIVQAITLPKRSYSAMHIFERRTLPHLISCLTWVKQLFNNQGEDLARQKIRIPCQHWTVLGSLCTHQSKYDEAKDFYELASEDLRQRKDTGVGFAELMLEMGSMYVEQKLFAEAERCCRSALDDLECQFDQPTLRIQLWLCQALSLDNLHRPMEVEAIYKKALVHSEDLSGCNYPRTIKIASSLAKLYHDHNNFESAEMLRRREAIYLHNSLGSKNLITTTTEENLTALCQLQGKIEEAICFLKRILTVYDGRLGEDHPSSLKACAALATIYHERGLHKEARQLSERAERVLKKNLGSDQASSLAVLEGIAKAEPVQKSPVSSSKPCIEVLTYKRRSTDEGRWARSFKARWTNIFCERSRPEQSSSSQDDHVGKRKIEI